jgi:hypothetical protein
MRVRKWVIASLLAAMLMGLLHLADRQVRWPTKLPPAAELRWMAVLWAALIFGLGAIGSLVLHLDESRFRDRIVGSALLAVPAAVVQVLGIFGVFEGGCLIARDAGRMLSTLLAFLFIVAMLTFAGVSIFRGIAYLRRRWHRPRPA